MWHLENIKEDWDDGYGNGESSQYLQLKRGDECRSYTIYREYVFYDPDYPYGYLRGPDGSVTFNVDVNTKKLYVTANGTSFEYELASYKECSRLFSPGGTQSQERIIF